MSSSPWEAPRALQQPKPLKTNLSLEQRRHAYELLLRALEDDELPYGAISDVDRRMECHRTTISRLWSRAQRSFRRGDLEVDIASKMR
ncbi:hypothetical protein AeNC1_019496, partial [Aphanomyces euteiches]